MQLLHQVARLTQVLDQLDSSAYGRLVTSLATLLPDAGVECRWGTRLVAGAWQALLWMYERLTFFRCRLICG